VDELIQDDEVEQDFKDTLRLWKEVNGPFFALWIESPQF
jgi:hypothetical protein